MRYENASLCLRNLSLEDRIVCARYVLLYAVLPLVGDLVKWDVLYYKQSCRKFYLTELRNSAHTKRRLNCSDVDILRSLCTEM